MGACGQENITHFFLLLVAFQGPSSSPVHRSSSSSGGSHSSHAGHSRHGTGHGSSNNPSGAAAPGKRQPVLKGVDTKLANLILDEIVEGSCPVQWDDIAGQKARSSILLLS